MIYHIAIEADWNRRTERFYAPSDWRTEGFVHCSTGDQLVRVANHHFRARRDLVLLTIDTELLEPLVVWEDTSDAGEDFPHIYGPIDTAAIVEAAPFPAGDDGRFDWWTPR